MNNAFVRGLSLINTITMSARILQFAEGCKLFETSKFALSDHRAYAVDINLKEYFREQLSQWESINKSLLASGRRSHREKFSECIEE